MKATRCTDNQAGNAIWHLLRRREIYVIEKRSRPAVGPANVYALMPEHDRPGFNDSALRAVFGL